MLTGLASMQSRNRWKYQGFDTKHKNLEQPLLGGGWRFGSVLNIRKSLEKTVGNNGIDPKGQKIHKVPKTGPKGHLFWVGTQKFSVEKKERSQRSREPVTKKKLQKMVQACFLDWAKKKHLCPFIFAANSKDWGLRPPAAVTSCGLRACRHAVFLLPCAGFSTLF